jgi:hypothetical protein
VSRDNGYGHLSPQALRLYEQHTIGAPVAARPTERVELMRTDEIGTIWIGLPDYPWAGLAVARLEASCRWSHTLLTWRRWRRPVRPAHRCAGFILHKLPEFSVVVNFDRPCFAP